MKKFLVFLIATPLPSDALVPSGHHHAHELSRRRLLGSSGACLVGIVPSLVLLPPDPTDAIAAAATPPPLLSSAPSSRVEDMGGGFDVYRPPALKFPDVIYPASISGLWRVQRAVTSVEGDKGQAEVAFRCLGGAGGYAGGDSSSDSDAAAVLAGKKSDVYQTRFIDAPSSQTEGYTYSFDGETIRGVICDRGFEISSRTNRDGVLWDPTLDPNKLSYGPVILAVIQRTVEPPTEQGFGSNELIRASTPLGGLTPGIVDRAIRVKRRYRRNFDESGNRIVEGLEIVTTYRVLDGIAGVEMPTSTTKSMLRMSRPPSV